MSESNNKVQLTPIKEGLIGGLAGIVLGIALWQTHVISAPAIPGVMLGLGLGSWYNARRREKNTAKDKGDQT